MREARYANNSNIPLALAVFLATDNYDHEDDVISATSLIKPIRQLVLERRLKAMEDYVEPLQDVSSLMASRMGTAIHDGIERCWTNPESAQKALKALGYPERVVSRIRVNPESPEPGTIPVYLEQRAYKMVGKFRLSGKFDFVGEGMVQDFKSTGVYTYIHQTNSDKYILQGSIYRWLNPEIITKDVMQIHFIFTDWNKMDAMRTVSYPQARTVTQKLKLLSYDQTDRYVRSKLRLIDELADAPDDEIPECGDEDLWRSGTVWKYYADETKTSRATKNFTDRSEAQRHLLAKGKGIVKEVPGQVKACRYCKAFDICGQKDRLIESGVLVI